MAYLLKSRLDCVEDLRHVTHEHPTKLDEYQLCKANLDKIVQHYKHLETLKKCSVMLQKKCTNLAEVNDVCDIVANLAENNCGV